MNGAIALVGLTFTCAALSIATTAMVEFHHLEGQIATQPCSAATANLAGCRLDAAYPVEAVSMVTVVAILSLNIGAIVLSAPASALIAALCTFVAAGLACAHTRSLCGAVCAELHCGRCDAFDPSKTRAVVVGLLAPATAYLFLLAATTHSLVLARPPQAAQSTAV